MIARYDPAFPHNPHQPETFTMSSAQQHINALAGGGFSMEPQNLALDRYILDQANTARPAVCFLPTASGDASQYIVNFFAAYTQFDCRPSYIPLFSRTPDLHSLLLNQDVIFVGGGNTKSMLAVWQAWGLPAILREAWQAGVVLAGVSAGAICWFEQGVTDSGANSLGVLDALGFLEGSYCPHYDSEPERRPMFHRFLQEGSIRPGYALDDGAALHYVGSERRRVVASRPAARAYALSVLDGRAVETPLPVEFLG